MFLIYNTIVATQTQIFDLVSRKINLKGNISNFGPKCPKEMFWAVYHATYRDAAMYNTIDPHPVSNQLSNPVAEYSVIVLCTVCLQLARNWNKLDQI